MSQQDLKSEIEALRRENAQLKEQLKVKSDSQLSLEEYSRYGRQMIVEGTGGVEGQLKLKKAKVLVIGAGGLGSPSLPYLVGAGIGKIGVVDNDVVDTSNLHRQVIHNTAKVGMLKCESAKQVLESLNPNVEIVTYPVRLNSTNAFSIFEGYDLVLDCTDTPLTRYLVSDVAVNLGMTVVSASGLGTEGQLSILNYKNFGPCYRCFYPVSPNPYAVSSCSEGGVIGPCIGLVGTMMAVETIKVLLDVYTPENFEPFLLMYSGFPIQSLRRFRMRGRQTKCQCCGDNRVITRAAIESGEIDYNVFCGARNYNVCDVSERIKVTDFDSDYVKHPTKEEKILLDVRPSHHYSISHMDTSINIPLKELKDMDGNLEELKQRIPKLNKNSEIIVLCRYGNDSQIATRVLKDEFGMSNVKDVAGGFFKYIDDVDRTIPKY
ncbi:hypothetical protein RNJ44_04242 [Nakaseomyces bracarensis]|uniref:Rhodanese domain-containing protein n=1 Tax=Nakaseomyces bracarensis TaxID=273131 RepID=A0ABR4NUJ0_9SACH